MSGNEYYGYCVAFLKHAVALADDPKIGRFADRGTPEDELFI